MKIEKDKVVSIHYTLTDKDGNVLDKSADNLPLDYLHGANNIIPGLEKELLGKQIGDTFSTTILAKDAYGDRSDEMMQIIPRDQFEVEGDVEVGMQFEVQLEDTALIVTVTEVNSEEITIDANHPLAGMDLSFEVEVIGIRDATAEELKGGCSCSESGCKCDDGADPDGCGGNGSGQRGHCH